ncbi:ROK family protein [Streptococcus iniae]|nr:ROK family protein [Streptococcus iniae]
MKVACFDIGGTGLKFALIGQDLVLKDKKEVPTPKELEGLLAFIADCLQGKKVDALSFSFPGAIDKDRGQIMGISAVPYIHGPSWYDLLADYHLPIYLENDANCVGLSQLAISKEIKNFMCVVCGTGIGGALVIDRKLIAGPKAFAGEYGCMIVDSSQKPIQNWSQLASTGSLVRQVTKESHKDLGWTGRKIFEVSANGDQTCQNAINRMIRYLAIGMMNLYYCCDPEMIFIGGGISQNPDFINQLKEEPQQLTANYEGFPVAPEIAACHYHQDANLIGAYMNTFQ